MVYSSDLSLRVFISQLAARQYNTGHIPPRRVRNISGAVAKGARLWNFAFHSVAECSGAVRQSTPYDNTVTAGIFVGDALFGFLKIDLTEIQYTWA